MAYFRNKLCNQSCTKHILVGNGNKIIISNLDFVTLIRFQFCDCFQKTKPTLENITLRYIDVNGLKHFYRRKGREC